jgi:hypothetical protein
MAVGGGLVGRMEGLFMPATLGIGCNHGLRDWLFETPL